MNHTPGPANTLTIAHPERVMVFHDYANIEAAATQLGVRVDHGHLLDYLVAGRFLVEAHCYVPIDPRKPYARDRQIEELWLDGYVVHTKVGNMAGQTYKCDFDVEIAMDATRATLEAKPDTVILVTGDCDFVPMVLELRKRGVRVEAAAFEGNGSRELILKSSGFVDLGVYAEDRSKDLQEEASEVPGQSEYAGLAEDNEPQSA